MPVSSPSYFPPNRADGTVVGITAGTNTVGSRNFLAMKGAGLGSTANDLFVIGDTSCNNGFLTGTQDSCIIIGNDVLNFSGPHAPPTLTPAIVIGHGTLTNVQGGNLTDNLWIGCFSAPNWSADPTGVADNSNNVIIGHACASGTSGAAQIQSSTFVGSNVYTKQNGAIIGCTAVGANILKGASGGTGIFQAFTLVGANIFENIAGSCSAAANFVAVGDNIAPNVSLVTSTTRDLVIVGSQAASVMASASDTVIVGSRAAQLLSAGSEQVLIGSQVAPSMTNTSGNVIIGFDAGDGVSTGSQNTCVGTESAPFLSTGSNNVFIGNLAGGRMTTSSSCIVIGDSAQGFAAADTLTLIGQGSSLTHAGAGSIVIGGGAGTDAAGPPNVTFSLFFVGNFNEGYLYGNMDAGNLLVGKSSAAQREFGGAGATNALKLIAGSAGGSAPNGGGYFYATGANNSLHWVNSAGIDSTLSDAAILSSTTLTSAAPAVAAAQVSFGSTTATSATAGANGATPAQVAGYLIINVAGTAQKIPYYNT